MDSEKQVDKNKIISFYIMAKINSTVKLVNAIKTAYKTKNAFGISQVTPTSLNILQCLYLEVPSVIADDVKQKEVDALNEVKNCTIPDVINRRELLVAFLREYYTSMLVFAEMPDIETIVDDYLKSN